MPLTLKQRRFVDAYLGACNGNVTKAAIAAGYSPRSAYSVGHETLKNPEVAAEIKKRYEDNTLPVNEVLHRLSDQARGIGEFVRVGKKGRTSIDLKALVDAGKGHLVKCLRKTQHGTTIEFYDAQNALIHIGRHYELFTDKQKTEGKFELIYEDLSEAELDRRIAELEGREAPEAGPTEPGPLREA